MKKQFFEFLSSLARSDERIFLLVGDIGYGAIEPFVREFPDRFLNVGVAEQNMATIAAGLAKKGFRPFIYSIANFPLLRAFEQVRNDIVHEGLPVTIVSIGTGFDYGNLGYSHHAVDDVAPALALSGLEILCPMDEFELRLAVRAIMDNPQPTYLRLTKETHVGIPTVSTPSDLNPRIIFGDKSCNLALVGYGSILERLWQASNLIDNRKSQKSAVISMPDLRTTAFEILRPFGLVFLVEEQSQGSGLSGMLSQSLDFQDNKTKFRHIGIVNVHKNANGSSEFIRKIHDLDSNGIASRVSQILGW